MKKIILLAKTVSKQISKIIFVFPKFCPILVRISIFLLIFNLIFSFIYLDKVQASSTDNTNLRLRITGAPTPVPPGPTPQPPPPTVTPPPSFPWIPPVIAKPKPTPTPAIPGIPPPPTIDEDKLKDIYIVGEPIEICGETIPNGIITIYLNGEPFAVFNADENGHFCYTITDLPPGDYELYLTVTDENGNTSQISKVYRFKVVEKVGWFNIYMIIGLILLLIAIAIIIYLLYKLSKPNKLAIIISEGDQIALYLSRNRQFWQMPIKKYKKDKYEKTAEEYLYHRFGLRNMVITKRLKKFKYKDKKILPLIAVSTVDIQRQIGQIGFRFYKFDLLPQQIGEITEMVIDRFRGEK